ncbi:MAG TPA: hypothetical protein VNM14_07870 [Planctomycetota bacterium]|nr:hypothetical protein [Planctomycetota bacterium]
MDEPEEDPNDLPIVILDDDDQEQAPPPRRRRWIWVAAAAGAVLIAALGSLILLSKGRPVAPASMPATEIAFAGENPIAVPEPPPAPGEPLPEDPAEVQPPPPPPPVVAEAPVTKPEPPVVAKEEAPPPPPPPPPGQTIAKAPEPPPAPPKAEETVPVEKELAAAATSIRDAEPLFREAAEALEKGDPRDVVAKMDHAERLLLEARETYGRRRLDAPDPETVETRIAVIDELVEALKEGRARIRVPLALKEADALEREAAPLAKEALDGFQPGSHDAQALDVKAEAAAGKLRDARERYLSVRNSAPDPKSVDKHLKSLDALLERLEKRYPAVSAR